MENNGNKEKYQNDPLSQAVKTAVADELEGHRRAGREVVVLKDGKITKLEAEEIQL